MFGKVSKKDTLGFNLFGMATAFILVGMMISVAFHSIFLGVCAGMFAAVITDSLFNLIVYGVFLPFPLLDDDIWE